MTLDLHEVTLRDALKEISGQSGVELLYSGYIVPLGRRVSVTLRGATVEEALRAVLRGTRVGIRRAGSGAIMLTLEEERRTSSNLAAAGAITGRITDAGTGEPVSDATVSVDDASLVTRSGSDGTYRLARVTAGTHRLVVRRIGYAKVSRDTVVKEGEQVTMDFALQASANVLDQIVVTGTVAPTERRALANPITVVGSKEIEEQSMRRVDQIFRGIVPGSIAWQEPGYEFATTVSSRGASSLNGSTVKTYVDGIEVADAPFIASIDPNSIDHIEFARGPQASTIYGSDADGGVLQIFTKKGHAGSARPEVDAKVTFGAMQSGYRDGAALRQDHSVALNGGGERFSYNVGGSYQGTGEFVPGYTSRTLGGFGGASMTQGPVTASFSVRYSNRRWEKPQLPMLSSYPYYAKPWNRIDDMSDQAYAIHLEYSPTTRWHHSLTLGQSGLDYEYYNFRARYTTPADSLRELFSSHEVRSQLAYNTTLDLSLGRDLSSTLTAGVDYYHMQANFMYSSTLPDAEGALAGLVGQRLPWNNTGYFAQLQTGVHDLIYITAGLRAERNDNFGDDYGLAYSPRVGVSVVHDVAGATVKLRASYGDAIRPPFPTQKSDYRTTSYVQLPNPELGPERQLGWDGGFDLFFGKRASLSVTHYDQTARNLIDQVLIPDSTSAPTYQYQNAGQIANRGWEFEGHLRTQRVDLTATYSIVSSRISRLAPHYSGDYDIGDRVLGIPGRSGGVTVAYRPTHHTTVTGNLVYIGPWTNLDVRSYYGFIYGGDAYLGSGRAYWMRYPSVTKVNLGVAQEISSSLTGFVRVENVANEQTFENYNTSPQIGRTTLVGVRLRY
ncbi:MAG TPA: TonB-dependent receptor [Gemmatimonadaceae bacterium]